MQLRLIDADLRAMYKRLNLLRWTRFDLYHLAKALNYTGKGNKSRAVYLLWLKRRNIQLRKRIQRDQKAINNIRE